MSAEKTYDVVVLGAGISGLVGTSIMLDQGATSVLVVDEYDHLGGNHIDATIGDYTFDVGCFLFQTSSPLVQHFPELLERYEPARTSVARLNPQGQITAYPFSAREDILSAGPGEISRILGSGVRGRLGRAKPANAGEWARNRLGARLVERSGLGHYMERLCGCPMDEIDIEFARSRMKWIERAASAKQVKQMLFPTKKSKPAKVKTAQSRLVRPRSGFAELYAPVRESLEARGVDFALGRPVESVRRTDEGYDVVRDGVTVRARRVISTIPVTRAAEICGLPVPDLPTVTLLSLFYSFQGERGFKKPILYNFSFDARWKRMTMYSDIYGPVEGREYVGVEVVTRPDGTTTPEAADAEFRAHVAANGLFVGDLRLEGSNVLTNAYPIFTAGSRERADAARHALEEMGIGSFGRQGGFQYQPTAKVATREAEAALGVRAG